MTLQNKRNPSMEKGMFETVLPLHTDQWQPALTGSLLHLERLLSEKAHLESELRCKPDTLSAARVATEDQPSVVHDQFLSIYRNNFAYTKWKEIEAALDRLRSGEYGVCQECETRIADRRLNALPWARYCLTCQEDLNPGRDTRTSRLRLAA
jgi:DnaK suppressor protein